MYVPDVSEADIARIVARDSPPEAHDAIDEMIRGVEVREKTRVVLACLENAKGSLSRLEGELAHASGYWRDMIGEAEYATYVKVMFRIDKLSADEKQRIAGKTRTSI